MRIEKEKFDSTLTPLIGFVEDNILSDGSIALLIIVGNAPKQSNVMVMFLVVICPFAYNVIMCRPSMNNMKTISSTYLLPIKFSKEDGVGVVHGY